MSRESERMTERECAGETQAASLHVGEQWKSARKWRKGMEADVRE